MENVQQALQAQTAPSGQLVKIIHAFLFIDINELHSNNNNISQ